jgi:hypothetical protein
MSILSVAQLVPVLMTAVGPAILISAVGLLLLTMTNRLGRIIDRSRSLDALLRTPEGQQLKTTAAQLDIFWQRARLVRAAIILAATSALFAALLVIVLFVTALAQAESAWLIVVLFTLCLLSLIAALGVFIHDVNHSLGALKLETAEVRERQKAIRPPA